MKYSFTVSGNKLIITLDTQLSVFKEEIFSFKESTVDLGNDKIYLYSFGVLKNTFVFNNIKDISGIAPTNIIDAYNKILLII
jgi:hypothetical protein